MKQKIQEALQHALSDLGVDDVPVHIETPEDLSHGDYTTNVAMIAFASVKGEREKGKFNNPRDLAEEIINNFKFQISNFPATAGSRFGVDKIFDRVEVAGPGFINFWLSQEYLLKSLHQENPSTHSVNSEQAGSGNKKHGKKIVVEYSSPNIAKPFTIGHLRSTIIGHAVANLFEATGWEVYRDNHLGDWGTQFGKQIYAIKEWGNENEIASSDRPVKLLVELYVKFHQEAEKDSSLEEKGREWFKKLEDGDEEARRLWQKCIEWSWKEFDAIYKELGVSFTENGGKGYGESFFEDKMGDAIRALEEKHLLKEGKEGAKIVEFPEETKLPPLMILKKDGASLYATRDLATDKFRRERYGEDVVIINEVGAEQSLYWNQIYLLEEMLGWYQKGQRVHVKHGLYRFKEGKMSTRKGDVIWLEDVLAEAKTRAMGLMNKEGGDVADREKLAHVVGIGAIKWNDLKRASHQDIVFDWGDILNMQGNSGPYIQYSYVRTRSILAKSNISNFNPPAGGQITNYNLEDQEVLLLRKLHEMDDVMLAAAEKYAPHMLCTYLFGLSQEFNLFYEKLPILKADEETKNFRLALVQAVGQKLAYGLLLLGIETPEKM